MRASRKVLRVLCALSFAGGAALLALGAHVAVTAHLYASAAVLASLGGCVRPRIMGDEMSCSGILRCSCAHMHYCGARVLSLYL